MTIQNTFSRDKHLIFVLLSSALIFLPFECSPNGMTRGKNSRRFRGIHKDFRGEKNRREIAASIVTCNKVARSLIERADLPRRGCG